METTLINSLRYGNALSSLTLGTLLAVPGLWRLGLDQGAWIALAAVLSFAAARRPRTRLTILAAAFIAVVVVAGTLGAEGYRWITFGREVVIAMAFFGLILGVAALDHSQRLLRYLILGLAFVLAVSSLSSLLAFVTQSLFVFKTPIAALVPEAIASTRLGELSFTDRSLGTSSFFLGHIFVRPHGLFLFSTSQAVAQAVAVPILLAAGRWYPELRGWFVAVAAVSMLALLATTTRVPIIALPLGITAIAAIGAIQRGGLESVRRRWRLLVPATLIAVVVLAASVASGAADPVAQMLSARSLGPRTALYLETIEEWTKKPVLGWGTEIDWDAGSLGDGETPDADETEVDPTQLPPLGSHSHYLGVLFKQGAVGFIVFAAFVVVTAAGARRWFMRGRAGADLLVASFAVSLLVGLTESLWLDPAAAVVVGLSWGLVAGGDGRPEGDFTPPSHNPNEDP